MEILGNLGESWESWGILGSLETMCMVDHFCMVAEAILQLNFQRKCSSWASMHQNFACNGYVTVKNGYVTVKNDLLLFFS